MISEKEVSAGVTAFIDILGFGNKVLDAKSLDDLNDIHKSLKLIQEAFDFDTSEELVRDVQKLHATSVLAFSDCVVVNIPLQSDATKYEGTFDPIMSEITGFAYAQGTCCLKSLFIRGGIDLGWWYQNGPTLISQSMVNAYKAEGCASVPVIALTTEFYDYFSSHKHRNFYSEDYDPIPKVFRKYQENGKEYFYIDYITICLESLDWQHSKEQLDVYRLSSPDDKNKIMSEGYRKSIDDWLITHARNIEAAHNIAGDEKVKTKYEWLCKYHNEITNNFTRNQSCQCSL
jgi:hypothetical protein